MAPSEQRAVGYIGGNTPFLSICSRAALSYENFLAEAEEEEEEDEDEELILGGRLEKRGG